MNCGVLIFPEVEELDFAGPWELLGMWSKFAGGPETCLVVAQSAAPVICAKGLIVTPHCAFAQCPPLDFLLVPGGQGTEREADNPVLIDFIAQQARTCRAVFSVCTGAFLLHRAGLLAGRKAVTHWSKLEALRALGDVDVVEERYTQDGNIWTAAGVSAGMDAMLALIAAYGGEKAAGIVQCAAEYYPSAQRYGGFHTIPQAPAYLKRTAGEENS